MMFSFIMFIIFIYMDKEILMFGNVILKLKKINFTIIRLLFFWKILILKKYYYLTRFLLVKKL